MDFEAIKDIVLESFNVGNTAYGLGIAFFVALMMSRYGQILYFTVVALVLDLLVVPLGIEIYENGGDFTDLLGQGKDLLIELSGDLQYIIIRAVFFLVMITVFDAVKSIFRRG